MAEFRFSFFHVLELVDLDPAHKPHAQERVEFVKALCGRRAFLHSDKLRRLEALSRARKSRENSDGAPAQVYLTDASWLPQSIVAVVDRFTDALVRGLKNRIAKQTTHVLEESAPNWTTRRAMKRKFVDRRGATKEAVKIAAKTPDYFFGGWQQVYPLTERFWRHKLLFEYLDKKVSKEELHRECLKRLCRSRQLRRLVYRSDSIDQAMPQAIRGTESAGLFDDLRSDAGQWLDVAKDILAELDLEPATRGFRRMPSSTPSAMPRQGSSDVAETFQTSTLPSSSSNKQMSVKVPPESTPTRHCDMPDVLVSIDASRPQRRSEMFSRIATEIFASDVFVFAMRCDYRAKSHRLELMNDFARGIHRTSCKDSRRACMAAARIVTAADRTSTTGRF